MNIFTKIGELVLRIFDIVGMLILAIPKIPGRLKSIDTGNIKKRVDSDAFRDNISKIKDDVNFDEKISKISKSVKKDENDNLSNSEEINQYNVKRSTQFTPEEKERTILYLQIMSGAFLVISILYIFTYLSFTFYCILGILIIAYFLYLLFGKVKVMYSEDFNAYRDFFLMYILAGLILVLISYNESIVNAFSFSFLPSASILIFALILVAAIFLIFRIRYHRNYTYGTVIEAGEKTAYVKVDYDIRSNVKPDIYLVENNVAAVTENLVKLKVDEKLFNAGGNKPVYIIKAVEK